jgi:DNA-binding LacI/PurR family transcriptional regulator
LAEIYPIEAAVGNRKCTVHTEWTDTSTLVEERTQAIREIERLRRTYLLQHSCPRPAVDEAFRALHNLNTYLNIRHRMVASFSRSLESGDATAWVCINDELALGAESYLRSKGARIPADVSLVSFDNTLTARAMSITSYDFLFDRLGHAAMQHLARPSQYSAAEGMVVHVPGDLVVRRSSSRPTGTGATR